MTRCCWLVAVGLCFAAWSMLPAQERPESSTGQLGAGSNRSLQVGRRFPPHPFHGPRLAPAPASRTIIPVYYEAEATGETSAPADAAQRGPIQLAETPTRPGGPGPDNRAGQPPEHPLLPALRWAKTGFAELTKVQDYSCTLTKRERISGDLGEHEHMFIKVRHQPFSVYMYFLGPAKVKGQEAIYVAGKNGGKLLAHPTGIRHRLVGTVSLEPESMLAMSGNRYPITQVGLMRLVERLIEVGEHDAQFGECEVKYISGAKVNNRVCTCIQVVHPIARREFTFNIARIYVDNELNVPTRYEAYEWPKAPGGEPQLTEEYTYTNLKLNNGFTDADFDVDNPKYGFVKK